MQYVIDEQCRWQYIHNQSTIGLCGDCFIFMSDTSIECIWIRHIHCKGSISEFHRGIKALQSIFTSKIISYEYQRGRRRGGRDHSNTLWPLKLNKITLLPTCRIRNVWDSWFFVYNRTSYDEHFSGRESVRLIRMSAS